MTRSAPLRLTCSAGKSWAGTTGGAGPLAGQVAERFPETSLAILFAGGVRHGEQMLDNQPLTMTSEDTARVAGLFPQAQVVPAHIDGWAHSREHADQLQAAFEAAGVADRLHLLAHFCRTHETSEVPDPYYGGPAGFEQVLDMLEDACQGLLGQLNPQAQAALAH